MLKSVKDFWRYEAEKKIKGIKNNKKYNEDQQERKTLIKRLQALGIMSTSLFFIYKNIIK